MKRMTHNAKALFFVTLIVSLAMGLHLESVLAQEDHGHESPHGGEFKRSGIITSNRTTMPPTIPLFEEENR